MHRSQEPLYVNRAWATLHGMTVDEVIALPTLMDLVHETDRERLQGYMADRKSGNRPPVRYRYRALHKSGKVIWLEQFVRMFSWQGEPIFQNTIIDVDDQERRTDELRQQRQLMQKEAQQHFEALIRSNTELHLHQSIIDQMSERISVIDTDYNVRMTNQANLDFRQRTREEVVGFHLRETAGVAWFEQKVKGMLDRAFMGSTERHERETTGPDGNLIHLEVTCEPFRDPDGTIDGAILSARDITAAKEAEEQLRLVASVIEQVSDRISVVDTDYRYLLTNRANQDYWQRSVDISRGQPLAEVVGEKPFFAQIKPELDRCFAGETIPSRRTSQDSFGRRHFHDILMEPYREEDGRISGAVIISRDVTEAERLSERLAYQARYDELTGLLNRRAFEQHLQKSIIETRVAGRSDALCFIDLDQFKIVNDTVGHMVGDQLLWQVAQLLVDELHDDDVLARLGGDEFGLLFRGCSLRRAKRAAEQLIARLKDLQFFHEDLMFEVGASIGITAVNRFATRASDVMAEADLACYAAKDSGRNRVQIFKKRDVGLRRRREEMYRAGGIRAALDRDRFVLFGQPITPVTAGGDQIRRVEILLRMKGESGRLILPSAFIPAAERYGFMADVDRWVIRKTIAQLVERREPLKGIDVCINLSGVTLNDETSLDFIRRILTASNLLPEQISFEITETAAIRNFAKTQIFMDELRDWGCRFALDDFGSGVSSLSYLKRLPVDYLKIDGSFVRDVSKDRGSRAMVKAIGQMAKDLDIKTIAEGVEDMCTLEVLRQLGIDYAQGFAIGRPVPFTETVRAA